MQAAGQLADAEVGKRPRRGASYRVVPGMACIACGRALPQYEAFTLRRHMNARAEKQEVTPLGYNRIGIDPKVLKIAPERRN